MEGADTGFTVDRPHNEWKVYAIHNPSFKSSVQFISPLLPPPGEFKRMAGAAIVFLRDGFCR